MKFTTNTLLLVTAASLATAVQHQHGHRRFHERERRDGGAKVVTVPGPTVVAYEFDGQVIEENEVCKGIKNGTLAWAPGTDNQPDCDEANAPAPPISVATTAAAAPSASIDLPDKHGNAFIQKASSESSDSAAPSISSAEVKASASASASYGSSGKSGSSSGSFSGSGKYDSQIASNGNTDVDFPDGEIDCDDFPVQYGAIPIDWEGLGGYTGVQQTSILNGIVGNIKSAISGQGCSSGAYCSYACPPGYQKSQWPEQNSATSVGGLRCGSDNKLYLTNPSLSKKLCIQGTGLVSVVNKLDKNACICRTDYPGFEAETVPLNTQPEQTYPLTCPDSKTYFQHQGSSTTAQYYVNPSGMSVDKACQWGEDETASGLAYGNWAPVNMGVGTDDSGATWLSLLSTEQNYPHAIVALDYSIELKGDFGGSACNYTVKNGVGNFCTDSGCQEQGQYSKSHGSSPVPGCTVQLFSGTATYELTS